MNFWPFAQAQDLSLSESTRVLFWRIQAYGLILITFLSFFPKFFRLEEHLFFALLAVALALCWIEGKNPWVRTPIDLPLFLFVGWVLFTVPFAIDPAYSFSEWRKLAAQVLVFYWSLLVLRTCDRSRLTHGVVVAVLTGTLILCGYALVDFLVQGGSWKDREIRARAPWSDYNWLSTYLVIALPLIVAAGMVSRVRWQRIACGGLSVLVLLTQAVSYTRAGWLATVTQGLCFGVATRCRWVAMGVVLLCGGAVLAAIALSAAGYQHQMLSFNTFYYRLAVWKLMVKEIWAHPVVGIGYGGNTYMMRFDEYHESHDAGGFHSLFFMVAAGPGIPALVFLVWTFTKAFLVLLQRARQRIDSAASLFALATATMILGFAIRNLFDHMFAGSLASLFWILLASGMAELQGAQDKVSLVESDG